ncbi:succinate dehydrogenase [ubiquinone] cytochrome b small subunit B, mitochondrial-like [Artemia franciscana]|uniref:succinate dehydrogenase [ubiquinone] cytochrome b small subunit B, mitochondrial-like n=1 Tax=Artemia franciscana TaxID=6661 RepID=UPI0032DB81F7
MSTLAQRTLLSCPTRTIWNSVRQQVIQRKNHDSLLKRLGVSSVPLRFAATHSSQGIDKASKHWTGERVLSLVLVGVIPAAFAFPSPLMDSILALSATVHSHWGLEAIVIDYIRPKIFGETIPKVSVALVYALSAFTLGGLFYFNYTDVGISTAVKMLWSL